MNVHLIIDQLKICTMNKQKMLQNLGELVLLGGLSVLAIAAGSSQWLYFMLIAIVLLLFFTQDRLIGLFVAGWVGIFAFNVNYECRLLVAVKVSLQAGFNGILKLVVRYHFS
jgi:hypothetical protein